MITQKFKNDAPELKMEASASPATDLCSSALDDFYRDGYEAAPFLLMLYDQGRMPFSSRVPRDSFVQFIKEALKQFPFTGTFEAYIFIIEKVFGDGSGIQFTVPAPGKLSIAVNASSTLEFGFVTREFLDGVYVDSEIVDQDNANISFSGISGIDSQYQLQQLLSEIIPAGIFPSVSLLFFALYDFVAYEGGDAISMLDHDGNQIIFIEF